MSNQCQRCGAPNTMIWDADLGGFKCLACGYVVYVPGVKPREAMGEMGVREVRIALGRY